VQAQALHPLSDVGAVRRLVGQLGTELTRRMEQAQALPGSRQVRAFDRHVACAAVVALLLHFTWTDFVHASVCQVLHVGKLQCLAL
jgi:hypothetical protein